MRTLVPAALGAALLALGTAPATAAAGSTYTGGCGFVTSTLLGTGAHTHSGVLYALAVLTSEVPEDNPVSATVHCELLVDGSTVHGSGWEFSGTGVAAGLADLTFSAAGDAVFELCETVDFTSDDTPTVRACATAERIELPPTEGPIPIWSPLDDLLCPVLSGDAPQAPGLVDVEEEGDVLVAGAQVWDCPPYDETW